MSKNKKNKRNHSSSEASSSSENEKTGSFSSSSSSSGSGSGSSDASSSSENENSGSYSSSRSSSNSSSSSSSGSGSETNSSSSSENEKSGSYSSSSSSSNSSSSENSKDTEEQQISKLKSQKRKLKKKKCTSHKKKNCGKCNKRLENKIKIQEGQKKHHDFLKQRKKLHSSRCKNHKKKNCKKCLRQLEKKNIGFNLKPKDDFYSLVNKCEHEIKKMDQKIGEKKKRLFKKKLKKKKKNQLKSEITAIRQKKEKEQKKRAKIIKNKIVENKKAIDNLLKETKRSKKKKCRKHEKKKCQSCLKSSKKRLNKLRVEQKKIHKLQKKIHRPQKKVKKKPVEKQIFEQIINTQGYTRICFLVSINNLPTSIKIFDHLETMIANLLDKGNVLVALVVTMNDQVEHEESAPFHLFSQDFDSLSKFIAKRAEYMEKQWDPDFFKPQPALKDWIGFFQTGKLAGWGNKKNIVIHINGNPHHDFSEDPEKLWHILRKISQQYIQKQIDYYFYRINNNFDPILISFFKTIHKSNQNEDQLYMKIVDFVGIEQFSSQILEICDKSQYGRDVLGFSLNNELIQKKRISIQKYLTFEKEKEKENDFDDDGFEDEDEDDKWDDWESAQVYILDQEKTNMEDVMLKTQPAYFKHYEDKPFSISKEYFKMGGERMIYLMCDNEERLFVAKTWIDMNLTKEEKIQLCQKELVVQYLAKKQATKFLAEQPLKSIDYLQQFFIVFTNRKKKNVYVCEPYIKDNYQKFSNNMREQLDYNKYSTVYGYSHYTYEKSDGKILVTDLQGWDYNGESYLLTDPGIHSIGNTENPNEDFSLQALYPSNQFNLTDFNQKGVNEFKKIHKCSNVCKCLKLDKVNSSRSYIMSTNRKFNYHIFCANIYCGNVVFIKNGTFMDNKSYYCTNCRDGGNRNENEKD
ncbi:eukaryotic elongation factor 2 kinase-related [Anaeramoeba flamelloides]|uniref:Eukaryotic elongation factor 2 kinase-related n=1 Tax=Anaeramoeba flamelloides TaxID=1746091 RepID=A0ABQ8YPQ4_9EUKA|nr:eukaryotic elongation factor 2 kinase-related [Anaeramoeba flamelloides]